VALLFQVGLYVTGGYDFFQHIILLGLLLLFLEPEWWQRRLGVREQVSGSSLEPRVPTTAP
jgi:hypothetical protein